MYNPFTEKRLERFFEKEGNCHFHFYDSSVGYVHPGLYFILVYCLVHINRHIFDEGIGLRQIVDYYYIMKHSDASVRKQAFDEICHLRLKKFTGALMYVMKEVLAMDDSLLLCVPNEKLGKRLLDDIMQGGNFGKYGQYANTLPNEKRIQRGIKNLKRDIQFLTTYSEEVLWIPYFKLWHWGWRKWHGYL